MRFVLTLAALMMAWQNFGPTAAFSLEGNDGACEDLSEHCPSLCTPCNVASNLPASSHDVAVDAEADAAAEAEAQTDAANDPIGQRRSKRYAYQANQAPPQAPPPPSGYSGGWFQVPTMPFWMPSWIPWMNNGHQPAQFPPMPLQPPSAPNGTGQGCVGLFNEGRQLIEAFCKKSCGRCGQGLDPLVAARSYISTQCLVAKGPSVAMALE